MHSNDHLPLQISELVEEFLRAARINWMMDGLNKKLIFSTEGGIVLVCGGAAPAEPADV